MEQIDIKLTEIRGKLSSATEELAIMAMNDSETYQEAIDKLKSYRWKLVGKFSNEIIEQSIDYVKEYGLNKQIEKPLK